MSRLTHKQKVKIARRMSGKQSRHFWSKEWHDRNTDIRIRVMKRENKELAKEIGLL